jgi:hypothetical protein
MVLSGVFPIKSPIWRRGGGFEAADQARRKWAARIFERTATPNGQTFSQVPQSRHEAAVFSAGKPA